MASYKATDFKCPKCRKIQKVGKQLHASWTCPNCHFTTVLSGEDKSRGYRLFKRRRRSY